MINATHVQVNNAENTDGLVLDGAIEVNKPVAGGLEVLIQRHSGRVSRYFTGNIQSLYKQAMANRMVVLYEIN
jgi:hypothetical protein